MLKGYVLRLLLLLYNELYSFVENLLVSAVQFQIWAPCSWKGHPTILGVPHTMSHVTACHTASELSLTMYDWTEQQPVPRASSKLRGGFKPEKHKEGRTSWLEGDAWKRIKTDQNVLIGRTFHCAGYAAALEPAPWYPPEGKPPCKV